MQSTNFVYQAIGSQILQYMPEASLQYSETFWEHFEPYFFLSEENVQAFAGELIKTDQEAVKCVFKMSQYEDNLVRHEYSILQSLVTRFGAEFPHICKPYGIVKYKSHISIRKGIQEETDASSPPPFVIREMLLLEKVPAICDLGEFAERCTRPALLMSLFKQVLMCIRLFRCVGLTHFDLHTGNILIRRCSPHLTLQYDINGTTFLIPTFGYLVVIIDFGFSYLRTCERPSSINCTLRCANVGLLTDRFMPFTDYIRFLHNICSDIRACTQNWKQALRRRTLKLFNGANFISRKSGWFKSAAPNRIDELQKEVARRKLLLFQNYDWIELTQILMPELAANDTPASAIDAFEREWAKIEERITDRNLIYYLYKYFVIHIQLFREDSKRNHLVKQIFLDEFTRLVNAFVPIVDYAVLIQCTLDLSGYLQGYLYKYVSAREAEILQHYQSLPFTDENCDNCIWNHYDSCGGARDLKPTQQRLLIKYENKPSH